MKVAIRYLKNFNFEYLFLLLWIILLPVMSNRYVRSGSLLERVQVSDIMFAFLFLIALIKFFKRRIKFTFTYLWFALTALSVSFLISTLSSDRPLVGFSELLIIIYLIFVYLFTANAIRDKRILSFCLRGWLFTSWVIALLGIGGMLFAFSGFNNYFVRFYPDFLNKAYRLTSTMTLPNMTYGYLHISFFLSLGLFVNERRKGRRIFYLFTIFTLLIAIFFTFSRGWASFLISLGLFFYFFSREKKSKLKFIAKVLFLSALIVFAFVQLFITYTTDLNFSFRLGYDDRYKVDYSSTAQNRLYKVDTIFEPGQPYSRLDMSAIFLPGEYWYRKKVAVKLWQQHPLFGIGPGMFNTGSAGLSESGIIHIPKNIVPSDPHSTYFGALAEEGLFGLLALFILFFYFLKKSIDAFKRMQEPYLRNLILCCISAFAGLLAFGIDVDIINFRWLWFLMGLSIAISRISELDKPVKNVT